MKTTLALTNLFFNVIKNDDIVEKISSITKDKYEKLKIDCNSVFTQYINNSYEKYSTAKTILNKTKPQYLYNFFVLPTITLENKEKINCSDINNLLNVSKFTIIRGTAGIGKSLFMKHLFLNTIKKQEKLPIFLELRDYNNYDNLEDMIYDNIISLGGSIQKEYLDYAFLTGCFLFLFDGYDEIKLDKHSSFLKSLNTLCDKYSNNYFVISSRPCDDFFSFQKFTVLDILPMTKQQAQSLVSKIDCNKATKNNLYKSLDTNFFKYNYSFASNPLLLNIMVQVFDNYTDIPEKLCDLYHQVFYTLYYKHDTSYSYKREMQTNFTYDDFVYILSKFCLATYIKEKTSFSTIELRDAFYKLSNGGKDFNPDSFIYDLTYTLCLLKKNGTTYNFAYNNFQEYFTVVYLKGLSDDKMKQYILKIAHENYKRSADDNVFLMLYSTIQTRFEQNILIPLLEEFEATKEGETTYDKYFNAMIQYVKIQPQKTHGNYKIMTFWKNCNSLDYLVTRLVHRFSRKIYTDSVISNDNAFSNCVIEKYAKHNDFKHIVLSQEQILSDPELMILLKDTWVGMLVERGSNMLENLSLKKTDSISEEIWNLF